ncbi:MAG: nucleotidyltransferase domain-containing protein [Aquificota bacterium]
MKKLFKKKNVSVYLFGSRSKGTHLKFSDIDLAFLSTEDISEELTLLRVIIKESNFPYKVDLVDLKKGSKINIAKIGIQNLTHKLFRKTILLTKFNHP